MTGNSRHRFVLLGLALLAVMGAMPACNGGSVETKSRSSVIQLASAPSPAPALSQPPSTTTLCAYQGKRYRTGATFPATDGCNTCTCDKDGEISCSLSKCASCDYAGAQYLPGDKFISRDGCNNCQCLQSGAVECTHHSCPCSVSDDWWRHYVSQDKRACEISEYSCPQNTQPFHNECGCGCEQEEQCPRSFNCEPPISCNVDELKTECPYSKLMF